MKLKGFSKHVSNITYFDTKIYFFSLIGSKNITTSILFLCFSQNEKNGHKWTTS